MTYRTSLQTTTAAVTIRVQQGETERLEARKVYVAADGRGLYERDTHKLLKIDAHTGVCSASYSQL